MAITTMGLYGLTLKDMLYDNIGQSLDSETLIKGFLVTNSYTPAYDTHQLRTDATTYEVGNSGSYSAGGAAQTSTAVTTASPAAGQLKFAGTQAAWTTATITARALIGYVELGTDGQDKMIWLSDFDADYTSTAGNFQVNTPTNGWWYIDYTE